MVDVKNAHGGYAGASIIERIQDELDLAYEMWMDSPEENTFGRAEAWSEALAILRSTTPEQEWKKAEERYATSDA